jgi:predicted NodU family carbamoyl transferase
VYTLGINAAYHDSAACLVRDGDVVAAAEEERFERRTGVPVLVNTSFNSRGEPVVCTPRDALESFWSTPLDALVIGSFIIEKPT